MISNVFSGKYVMKVTFHHMIRAIDISTRKTLSRLDELEKSKQAGGEVLETLSRLQSLRASLTKYMEDNPKLFGNKEY